MPILKHAKKKLKVDAKRAVVNVKVRNKARRAIKKVRLEPTEDNLKTAFSAVDRAAKNKVFHPRKADRLKSRMTRLLTAKPEKKVAKKSKKTTEK